MNNDCEVPTEVAVKTPYWKITLVVLAATVGGIAWDIGGDVLGSILKQLVNPQIASLSELFLIIVLVAALSFRRSWRRRFSFRFHWTWTLLLVLPFLLWNAVNRDPSNLALGIPLLMLVLVNFGVGLQEELFFRGFAFLGGGLNHPRYTVFMTSFLFSQVHWLNYKGGDWMVFLCIQIVPALTLGLAFGIIRVVTGSLVCSVLLHWLINLVAELSPSTNAVVNLFGDRETAISALQIFNTITFTITLAVLVRHPTMKSRKDVGPATTLPPPEPTA